MVYYSVDRSGGRSLGRSLGRSFGRSLGRSITRSIARSVNHCSIARSRNRSITRSVGRPVGRDKRNEAHLSDADLPRSTKHKTPQLIVLPIVDWAVVCSRLTTETRGVLRSVGSPTIGRMLTTPAGQTLLWWTSALKKTSLSTFNIALTQSSYGRFHETALLTPRSP